MVIVLAVFGAQSGSLSYCNKVFFTVLKGTGIIFHLLAETGIERSRRKTKRKEGRGGGGK